MDNSEKIIFAMIEYFGSDVRRINHFLKVYAIAKTIGEGEGLCEYEQRLVEAAAIIHDIGIKISEQKYNSGAGKYQELEGPAEAEKLLKRLNFSDDFISDVKYLVRHHHTYNNIDTKPYQILVEADFIVNLYEDNCSRAAVEKAYNNIFATKTGKHFAEIMFLNSENLQ